MTTLIIRLCEDNTKLLLHYDATGVLQDSNAVHTWHEVSAQAVANHMIILLPGTVVRMLPVTLPNMSMAELQQAVPNSLEEQLAEDIHELHFSIGDATGTNQRYVAIIQKKIWHTLLDELKTHNVCPDLIFPDYLALPLEQNCCTVYIDSKYMLLRSSAAQGFTSDANLLNTVLPLYLAQTQVAPSSMHIIHDPAVAEPHVDTSIPTTTSTFEFAQILQPNALLEHPPFNMLTRPFRKRRKSTERSYWYWCGVSFICCIAILFLSQLALYIDFKIKHASLDRQLLTAYQRVFPGVSQLIDPRLRVEAELKAYALNPNPVMLILQKIAQVKSKNSAISITTLNYASSKITMTITADTELQLTQFNKQLTDFGLHITSNQAPLDNKKISETLTIGLN